MYSSLQWRTSSHPFWLPTDSPYEYMMRWPKSMAAMLITLAPFVTSSFLSEPGSSNSFMFFLMENAINIFSDVPETTKIYNDQRLLKYSYCIIHEDGRMHSTIPWTNTSAPGKGLSIMEGRVSRDRLIRWVKRVEIWGEDWTKEWEER